MRLEDIDMLVRRISGRPVNIFAPDYSSVSIREEVERILSHHGCKDKGRDARLDVLAKRGGIAPRDYNFGIDGFSERIRAAVGKPLSDGDVVETMRRLQDIGCRNVKWYVVCALPGEREEDRAAFSELLNATSEVYSGRLQLSITHFQSVPHTPLELERNAYDEAAVQYVLRLREKCRDWWKDHGRQWIVLMPKGEHLHEHDAWLQRQGRRASEYLVRLAGRETKVQNGAWRDEARSVGLDPVADLGEIDGVDRGPWRHVETGTSPQARRAALHRYKERMADGCNS
jgi:hypothetical protein